MTFEEYQAKVDACFSPLPTPDEVINWAKENGYKFQCGKIGKSCCGCAIGAVSFMRYPQVLNDAAQFADGMTNPYNIFTGALYGTCGKPNDRRPIYDGFDDLYTDDIDDPRYKFGVELRKLAFGL